MSADPFMVDAIACHARTTPTATALVDGDGNTLRYGELHDRLTQVAACLRARGVRPGQRIGVVGHKTTDAVVALLGVWGAGATYVPLDPRAPAARLRELVLDAECALVLTDTGDQLDEAAPTVDVPTLLHGERSEYVPVPVSGDDIAYCMYTSGSTGRPKGVQIPHRALRAFFTAVWPLLEIDAGARCLNTSALHFDVSVVDLLLPLYRGATVHLGPLFPMPAVLTDVIERERITHMAAVGSTLALLAQHTDGFRGRDVTALRRLMTGAEVLDPRAVQAWLAAAPDLVVINGYGPTEATCLVVAHPIGDREPDRTEPYPIGRPLAGVRIGFLRDDGGIDDHGPGEILVAGDQVMTGYLNRPEENAFRDVDGVRFYRTGDRGHRRADGVLIFHGRHDDEVKVRGYRVNLNEVRRAVETHPDVGRAFVALVTDHRGAAVLSCAVAEKAAPAVPAGEAVELTPAVWAGSVRAHLAARLPGYMVPAAFHELAAVPTLPSGKPDTASILASLRAAHTAADAAPARQ